jgi:hypothetical protein
MGYADNADVAIFLALGAADQADLFKVVFGLEQVALFSLPHAVIGPGQSVVGIGGERLVVPIFGVLIAAKLAARITEQRCVLDETLFG